MARSDDATASLSSIHTHNALSLEPRCQRFPLYTFQADSNAMINGPSFSRDSMRGHSTRLQVSRDRAPSIFPQTPPFFSAK